MNDYIAALIRDRDTLRRIIDEDAKVIGKLTVLVLKAAENGEAYRRLVLAILDLLHEGQTRGLQDATVNRQSSRYDVQAMGRLESELERLERGMR